MRRKPKYDDKCVQCGELKSTIRKEGYFCAIMGNAYEEDAEVECEWPRHRFRPYTQKEIDAQKRDEEEMFRQMGDMADFFNKEMDKNLIK